MEKGQERIFAVSKLRPVLYGIVAILLPAALLVVGVSLYFCVQGFIKEPTFLILFLPLLAFSFYLLYSVLGLIHVMTIYDDRLEKHIPLMPFASKVYMFSDYDQAKVGAEQTPLIISVVFYRGKKKDKVIPSLRAYKNSEELLSALTHRLQEYRLI